MLGWAAEMRNPWFGLGGWMACAMAAGGRSTKYPLSQLVYRVCQIVSVAVRDQFCDVSPPIKPAIKTAHASLGLTMILSPKPFFSDSTVRRLEIAQAVWSAVWHRGPKLTFIARLVVFMLLASSGESLDSLTQIAEVIRVHG